MSYYQTISKCNNAAIMRIWVRSNIMDVYVSKSNSFQEANSKFDSLVYILTAPVRSRKSLNRIIVS